MVGATLAWQIAASEFDSVIGVAVLDSDGYALLSLFPAAVTLLPLHPPGLILRLPPSGGRITHVEEVADATRQRLVGGLHGVVVRSDRGFVVGKDAVDKGGGFVAIAALRDVTSYG